MKRQIDSNWFHGHKLIRLLTAASPPLLVPSNSFGIGVCWVGVTDLSDSESELSESSRIVSSRFDDKVDTLSSSKSFNKIFAEYFALAIGAGAEAPSGEYVSFLIFMNPCGLWGDYNFVRTSILLNLYDQRFNY